MTGDKTTLGIRMEWSRIGNRRGSFQNVPDLIAAINQYIQTHNQNPKVFVWSASVERIMGKIAKCKEALETLH